MKVDFNRKFKDFKGNELSDSIADKVSEALFSAGMTRECPIRNEDKFRAYKLSQKIINAAGATELSAEDITLIKEIVSNFLTAGAYGQVEELVEGKS
jgi:hypothetical protein